MMKQTCVFTISIKYLLLLITYLAVFIKYYYLLLSQNSVLLFTKFTFF